MSERRSPHRNEQSGQRAAHNNGHRPPAMESITLHGRRYDVLEQLAPPPRTRLLIKDRRAGGVRRLLLDLPNDDSTAQHLHVLKALPDDRELPRIVDMEKRPESIRVLLTWIKGIDQSEYLKRIRAGKVDAPTPFECVRLVRGLAHGLAKLHRHAGLIHGDLKPANIIATRKPSRLALIDFGSAWPVERSGFRVAGDGVSRTHAAPEQQTDDAPVDERADQFAASLLLYQLLTLQIPYENLGGQAGLPHYRNRVGRIAPPSELLANKKHIPRKLRQTLDQTVLKGLALNREERYPHSGAWLDALESIYLQLKLRQTSPSSSQRSLWDRMCGWLADKLPSKDTT